MDPSPKHHHHHNIVPVALIALGIPIAAFGLFLLMANAFVHDEPLPNDTALLLSDIRLNEAENAFTEVHAIASDEQNIQPQPINDLQLEAMLRGESWDEAYATTLLGTYAEDVRLFHAAAGKSGYQNPFYAHPTSLHANEFPSDAVSPRFTAKLLALEGQRLARSGDANAGLKTVMEVVKVGQMMELGQGTLIEYLVGSAVKQTGLSALRQIAIASILTVAQSKDIARQLEGFRDSTAGEINAMKLEYTITRLFMEKYARLSALYGQYNLYADVNGTIGESPESRVLTVLDALGVTRYYYLPNQSLRFAAEDALARVANAAADCTSINVNPPQPTRSRFTGPMRLFERNAAGKLLADIGRVSYGGFLEKRCNESVSVSATQAVLAVNAYTKDTNAAPASFGLLVPMYLEHLPVDPYNGQPMTYVPAKKLVYSVGPKRSDVGGSPVGGDWQQRDNPSFSVGR